MIENGKKELNFHLYHEAPDTKKGTSNLPFGEWSRRRNVKDLKAQVTLLINGKKVSTTTNKAKINFPSFDVDIGENF